MLNALASEFSTHSMTQRPLGSRPLLGPAAVGREKRILGNLLGDVLPARESPRQADGRGVLSPVEVVEQDNVGHGCARDRYGMVHTPSHARAAWFCDSGLNMSCFNVPLGGRG